MARGNVSPLTLLAGALFAMPVDQEQPANPVDDQQPADNQQPADQGDNQQPADQGDNQKPGKLTVDIHGVTIEVDEETAKQIISKRQASKEQLRSLETQLEDAQRAREQAERRAQAVEAAKTGDITRLETELTERYTAQIEKMQRAVIRSNLEASLRANPDFIGGNASTTDAVNMLMASTKFAVDEATLSVKRGEDDVNKVVADFLATRDYFRKARPGPRGPRGETRAPHKQGDTKAPRARDSITAGLKARYGGGN